VAQDIVAILKAEGEQSVSVGTFVAPPQQESGTGAGLAARLIGELEKRGIKVMRRARLGVQGKFAVARNTSGHLIGKITVEMVEASGKNVGSFSREVQFHLTGDRPAPDSAVGDIDGICAIAAWTAPTAELPPNQNQKVRHRVLDERIQHPTVFCDGTRVKTEEKSLYAIEVLVGGKPRTAKEEEGQAFVPLKRDEIYAVRLINDSDQDAAVALSIDGLGLFTFSEKGEGYVHVMVPAHKATVIRGWYRTPGKADSFKVTGYAESPAAQLLAPIGKVGTITASFAAAWKKDVPPPADELASRLALNRGDQLATGRGPEISVRVQEVERHIGIVRAVVSVRYSRN
jgi:hypothetical protein